MSLRYLFLALAAGIATAVAMAMMRNGQVETWKAWVGALTKSSSSSFSKDRFQADLFDRVNYSRMEMKRDPLKIDPELEKFLQRFVDGASTEDLSSILDDVKTALPRYYGVWGCTASKPSLEVLLGEVQAFATTTDETATHMACVLIESGGGLSNTCLLVTGQRLQDFSPELVGKSGTQSFFNICALCNHPHICEVSSQQRSMTLECPSCRKTYAVVAADSHGRFRYVNEFLTGYHPPAKFPKDQTRIMKLFTIWSAVHDHCVYLKDPGAKKSQVDCWQTAVETQNILRGDCEDSSIYLADWLTSAGFDARVALGRYGDLGGHAWCVVRLDDREYLLESTEGRPDPENPPLVGLVGSRYVPEVQFDRKAIYVRAVQKRDWGSDYWNTKAWARIEPRGGFAPPREMQIKREGLPTTVFYSPPPDPSRMAFTASPSPAAAPFADLTAIPAGSLEWCLQFEDTFGKALEPPLLKQK